MIEAADQAIEFGNLLGLFPDVNTEKNDEGHQADGQSFETKFGRTQSVPREPGEGGRNHKKQEKGEAPQFLLALFILVETSVDRASGIGSRRGVRLIGGLLFRVHSKALIEKAVKGLPHDRKGDKRRQGGWGAAFPE